MPEISRFYGIIVKMYYNEHTPPHFHVEYQEFKAEYNINTLEIIKGSLPKRANSLILEWAFEHRQELLDNWNLRDSKKELVKIEPLK